MKKRETCSVIEETEIDSHVFIILERRRKTNYTASYWTVATLHVDRIRNMYIVGARQVP